jgi:type II secretory pathway predicted ATPase ExeA/predicted  nucleic acid-binding Zn-ribbon protein
MYLKHYNLTSKPFGISPDLKFLWLGEKHKEALDAMKNGILENKGFIFLTGDVGTGKTTLGNALANILGNNIIFAQVADPSLEQLDFLNLRADAFEVNKTFSAQGDFFGQLRHFLNTAYVHKQEVVLVFDEAQKFDPARLEEVRLILNLQPDKKLINSIFIGQNEFVSMLKENHPLRREFEIIHKIEPLPEIETEQYVMHRLKIAGSEKRIFSPEAVHEIYSFSEGNPRLINIICDFALSTGYAKEVKIIEPEIIRECAENCLLSKQQKDDAIEDLRISAKSISETGTGIQPSTSGHSYQKVSKKVRRKPAGLKLAYVAPMFMIILLCIFGYLYFLGKNNAPPGNLKTSLETQPGQLKSSDDEPSADVKELKNANARVAALESAAAIREQMLSELTEELDREKKNRELLSSELSSKVDLIGELQQKLENSQPNTLAFETELDNSSIKIDELQEQLLNLKAEKASAETQLDQLSSRNAELTADIQKMKGFKERVAALESELATSDQTLSRPEQQLSPLAKELSQEKKSKELLNSELSSKEFLIARLKEELEKSQSNAAEFEAEIENRIIQIRELQGQLLNLKLEMTSPETQLGQLRSRNEELTAELEEQKGVKELVVGLESELTERDQTISFLEQRLSHIAKELDQEKKDRELLSPEDTSKADLISELQQKLQTSQSNLQELEKMNKNGEKEIAELQNQVKELEAQQALTVSSPVKEIADLQGQLSDLKAQKTAVDTQLGPLKSRNEELTANIEALKGAKERAAALEGELAERDQAISLLEQRLSRLAKELDQEKKSRELLSSELSKKSELVSEFQQKLQASQSNRQELEKTIKKGEKDIVEIQNQLRSLKARQTATEPSAVIDDVKEKSTSKIEASGEQDELPRPSNIIDYVLKKKAK